MSGRTEASTKLLIVNADDYGLTEGISAGILDGHRRGVISSTTVIALAPAFDRTIDWLLDEPRLGAGLHLAVVGEDPPLLSAGEVPTLVDRRGRLASSWRTFLPRVVAGRVDSDDLRREFAAQLERFGANGLRPTHLDTHQHLHLWPTVRQPLIELARSAGIRAVRAPSSARSGLVGRGVRHLRSRLLRDLASAGITHPEAFAGLDEAGTVDTARLADMVAQLGRAGTTSAEIGIHPGRADDAERERYEWGYRWADELAAACSAEARRAVDAAGFTLGTFADLDVATADV